MSRMCPNSVRKVSATELLSEEFIAHVLVFDTACITEGALQQGMFLAIAEDLL